MLRMGLQNWPVLGCAGPSCAPSCIFQPLGKLAGCHHSLRCLGAFLHRTQISPFLNWMSLFFPALLSARFWIPKIWILETYLDHRSPKPNHRYTTPRICVKNINHRFPNPWICLQNLNHRFPKPCIGLQNLKWGPSKTVWISLTCACCFALVGQISDQLMFCIWRPCFAKPCPA